MTPPIIIKQIQCSGTKDNNMHHDIHDLLSSSAIIKVSRFVSET